MFELTKLICLDYYLNSFFKRDFNKIFILNIYFPLNRSIMLKNVFKTSYFKVKVRQFIAFAIIHNKFLLYYLKIYQLLC
jgi:hypothetical protein